MTNREHSDREIEEVRKQVDERMRIMKENSRAEKIQVVVNPNLLKADNDLKFYGDGRIRPVVFLKQLIERMEEYDDREDYRKVVRRVLKGKDIIEEKCDTWKKFQEEFTEYYWGEQAQSKVREKLYTGKFEENLGNTREDYAMREIGKARYLDPPMSDKDIVQYVARHYNEDIREVIAIQGIDSVEGLLKYLKRIDSMKPIRRRTERQGESYEY